MLDLRQKFKIKAYIAANGLRVYLIPKIDINTVSINLAYKVGSKNERVGNRGMAHLFEHLMFEGSANIPKGEFDRICTLAGGTNNAYTSYDQTAYTMTLPSSQLELGLWLDSDRMLEFSVTQDSLETQQKVVTEEIRQTVFDRPYGRWRELLSSVAYSNSCGYNWEVHGHIEDVENVNLARLREFFDSFYRPDNAVLSICGNIDIDHTLELIEQYYGSIPHSAENKIFNNFNNDFLIRNQYASYEDSVPLDATFINYHLPGFNDDLLLIADVISNIASNGKSSYLYRELIDSQQIASSVGSFVDRREDSSILTFYAISADTSIKLETLKTELNKIINTFADILVNENDLKKTVNQLITQAAFEIQYSAGLADIVSSNLLFNQDESRIYEILEKYSAISRKQVKDFAQKYLIQDDSIVIDCLRNKI